MYILLLLYFLLPSVSCVHEKIVTVKNKTHIMCLSDDLKSAIYINPPLATKSEALDFLQHDELWGDDWKLKNSFETMQHHITDKRWEDFEIIQTDYQLFQNVSSVSFSIYSPDWIEFYINDLENLDYYVREPEKLDGKWIHYSIISNNKTVDIYEGSTIIRSTDLIPQDIVIKTPQQKFWKIHKRALRIATNISHSPTIVTIPSELSCLTLYATLCSHCNLLIEMNEEKYTFLGGSAKVHQLSITNQVKLTRSTNNGLEEGSWQIEAWRCPNKKSGKAIYEAIQDAIYNSTCNILTNYNEIKDYRRKRSLDERPLFDCPNGYLGGNCDISCESLLGPEKKTCQEHKICEKFSSKEKCFCAWGYNGTFCDKPCTIGSWGLDCQKNCPVECFSCNTITGKCNNQKTSEYIREQIESNSTMMVLITVVTGTVLISVVAASLWYVVKRYRRRPTLKAKEKTEAGKLLRTEKSPC